MNPRKRRKLKRGKLMSEILEGLRKSLVVHKKVKERKKETKKVRSGGGKEN